MTESLEQRTQRVWEETQLHFARLEGVVGFVVDGSRLDVRVEFARRHRSELEQQGEAVGKVVTDGVTTCWEQFRDDLPAGTLLYAGPQPEQAAPYSLQIADAVSKMQAAPRQDGAVEELVTSARFEAFWATQNASLLAKTIAWNAWSAAKIDHIEDSLEMVPRQGGTAQDGPTHTHPLLDTDDGSCEACQVEAKNTEWYCAAHGELHCRRCQALADIERQGAAQEAKGLANSVIDRNATVAQAESVIDQLDAAQDSVRVPRELLIAAKQCVQDMRNENKLHGHITDASAKWAIRIEPQIDAMLSARPQQGEQNAAATQDDPDYAAVISINQVGEPS